MLAVVLAAGRGTRLMPLTSDRSKPMMPVAGQPMIDHVLAMLAQGGAESIIVVAHASDRELAQYLTQSPWSARIQIVYQRQRLGMAHALECAVPLMRQMGDAAFLLASCDNLYPEGHVATLIADLREHELDAALTLMWTPCERATSSAVVVLDKGLVVDIIEKPDLAEIPTYDRRDQALSAPSLYVLSSHVLEYLPHITPSCRGEREFPEVLRLLIADGGKVGGQTVSRRMTLTTPRDLLALNRQMLQDEPDRARIEAQMPADVVVVPPVRIEAGASVAPGCEIGPEAYLESSCCIGRGTVVRRSIVMRRAWVKPNSVVDQSVISSAWQSNSPSNKKRP